MLEYSEDLFQKNLNLFLSTNNQKTISQDEIDKARSIRDLSDWQKEFDDWKNSPKNAVFMPCYNFRSLEAAEKFQKLVDQYPIENPNVVQYHDVHADIHQMSIALKLRGILEDINVDPDDNQSLLTRGMNGLICLGTGDGVLIKKLIEEVSPSFINVTLAEWVDFYSSFWVLDWSNIYTEYNSESKSIKITRVHSKGEALAVACKPSLISLDQAYLYSNKHTHPELKKFAEHLYDDKPSSLIQYLGYTVDEYNMIMNTSKTLKKSPKSYLKPSKPLNIPFIVTGSGPSLDSSLPIIKDLSSTHVVIAAGSNYSTLLKYGIVPDYLVLVEREDDVYRDYKKIYDQFGMTSTKLVMSTTCPAELISLYQDVAVFFRPAITPLAVFTTSINEVLNFEGPETVNTGVGLAAALGASSIALFGCDLGTVDLDYDRSKFAEGLSPRIWDQQVPGNFAETVYSNKLQQDCAFVLSQLALTHKEKIRLVNCSNGSKIKDFDAVSPEDYRTEFSTQCVDKSEIQCINQDWWDSLPTYSVSKMQALWNSRNPRESTFKLCRELEALYCSPELWFPNVLIGLDKLMDLNVPIDQQFPRRIVRSSIYKATLAVTQQFKIMGSKATSEQLLLFGAKAKDAILQLIINLELEIYDLCDHVESLR